MFKAFTALLLRFLPGEWIGVLEYFSGSHHRFYPWGPMNGQTARWETTRTMIHDLGIARIIETGTYRGTTTEWLASFGLPITTIEISPRFYSFALRRLQKFPNVELRLGQSTDVLKDLIASLEDKHAPAFFYLDAHWHDYLPLAEELELVSSNFANAYVLVDDFHVPHDDGYGYDDYGPDKRLTLDYVNRRFPRQLHAFFPRTASAQETGNRRGWVVFCFSDENAARLKQIAGLQPTSSSEVVSRT